MGWIGNVKPIIQPILTLESSKIIDYYTFNNSTNLPG